MSTISENMPICVFGLTDSVLLFVHLCTLNMQHVYLTIITIINDNDNDKKKVAASHVVIAHFPVITPVLLYQRMRIY